LVKCEEVRVVLFIPYSSLSNPNFNDHKRVNSPQIDATVKGTKAKEAYAIYKFLDFDKRAAFINDVAKWKFKKDEIKEEMQWPNI